MGISGPPSDPLRGRITEEHITQILNGQENEYQRAHESENSERRRTTWLTAWFGTLGVGTLIALTMFFGVREQYEIIAAIVTGVLGFAGGFGVGRMRR
jgi:hypothetical protein